MAASRHFSKFAWSVTACMLALTILFLNGEALGLTVLARTMGYEDRLFDTSRVHTIDIVMDDWDGFLRNCENEEYEMASVVIDGEAYKNVGIRAKGNTSLSSVSAMGSQRYSFKIEFDHYDKTRSYYGLDKLCLNNLIQDNTMMKDYLTYRMMAEFGVASPLCSYVYITVNGEDWGLYLAVEGIEEAFLERNYGSDYGELYKPDSMSFGGGRGNGMDFDMDDFMDNWNQIFEGVSSQSMAESFSDMRPDGGKESMAGNFGGGFGADSDTGFGRDFGANGGMNGDRNGGMSFGMGSSDVKLQYIDEEPDSYSNIWDNAKTDITEADQRRLIASLKAIASGEDIESAVDVDAVIRYFVVHNTVCNDDSYTGTMVHNYYLYEKDGQLSMIPWDYNLAFGTFSASDAAGTVNTPIDSPVSGGSVEDRPMFAWILESEEYTELYHKYFSEFLDSVDMEQIITEAYTLIAPYVEQDPTRFCTVEEFTTGVEALRLFCQKRSESIRAQLDNGETTVQQNYADTTGLTLSDMGSMNSATGMSMPDMPDMGNMPGGTNGEMPDMGDMPGGTNGQMPDMGDMPGGTNGQMPDMGDMPGGTNGQMPDMGDMPGGTNGEMPDMGSMPGGTNGEMPDMGNMPGMSEDTDSDVSGSQGTEQGGFPTMGSDGMQRPGGMNGMNDPFSGTDSQPDGSVSSPISGTGSTLIWLSVSALFLAIGLVIAKKFRY